MASAVIWASIGRAPCPISTVLASTVTLPSALIRTTPTEVDGVIVPLMMHATPLPRLRVGEPVGPLGLPQPIQSADSRVSR